MILTITQGVNICMYKFSEYNLIQKNFDNQYYVYNTLSRKCDLISKQIYDIFKKRKLDIVLNNSQLLERLVKRGYITTTAQNEIEYIEYKYNSIVWDAEVLDLTIVMTHRCNFKCIYCYQHEENDSFDNESANKIKKFIDKKTRSTAKKVYINWFGGEPLLETSKLLELSDYVVQLGRKNSFSYLGRITTNGYLLTQDLFLKLLNSHIFFYMITIDGIKEYHNKQRPLKNGNGTYDTILQNLREIKKINRTYSIDIRVNVSNDNYNYIEDFIIKWNGEFGGDSRFHVVFEAVHDWLGDRINSHKEQVISDIKLITNIYKLSERQGAKLQDYLEYNSEVQFCPASKKNGFVITNDASVYKCEMAMNDKVYCCESKIGYIDDMGKIHIDKFKEAKWLTRKENLTECYKCIAYPFCMGGAKCNYAMKFHRQINCSENIEYLKWMSSLLSKKAKEIIEIDDL